MTAAPLLAPSAGRPGAWSARGEVSGSPPRRSCWGRRLHAFPPAPHPGHATRPPGQPRAPRNHRREPTGGQPGGSGRRRRRAFSGCERRRAELILLPGSQPHAPLAQPHLSRPPLGGVSKVNGCKTSLRPRAGPGPPSSKRAGRSQSLRAGAPPPGWRRAREKAAPKARPRRRRGAPRPRPQPRSRSGHAPGPAFPAPLSPLPNGARPLGGSLTPRPQPASHPPPELPPLPSHRSSPQPGSRPLHPTHAGHWVPGPPYPPSHSHPHPHSPSGYPLTAGHPLAPLHNPP